MKIKAASSVSNVAGIKPKRNFVLTIFGAILIIVLFAGVFFGLNSVFSTETYYVLAADTPAKTQITETMLKEVIVSEGGAPQNSVTLAQVRQGVITTKYPLKAGDVLSESNTGITLEAGRGIPDDWVITSFNISSDNAVGGNITKGDYFDILGVSPENGSKYLFTNVLALEVNNGQTATTDEKGNATSIGTVLQYVVGMPAEEAAKLHHSIATFPEIKLILSPVSLKYSERNTSALDGVFTANSDKNTDLFKGTDNSFSSVMRDENGAPVTEKPKTSKETSEKTEKTTQNSEEIVTSEEKSDTE